MAKGQGGLGNNVEGAECQGQGKCWYLDNRVLRDVDGTGTADYTCMSAVK